MNIWKMQVREHIEQIWKTNVLGNPNLQVNTPDDTERREGAVRGMMHETIRKERQRLYKTRRHRGRRSATLQRRKTEAIRIKRHPRAGGRHQYRGKAEAIQNMRHTSWSRGARRMRLISINMEANNQAMKNECLFFYTYIYIYIYIYICVHKYTYS